MGLHNYWKGNINITTICIFKGLQFHWETGIIPISKVSDRTEMRDRGCFSPSGAHLTLFSCKVTSSWQTVLRFNCP